jgi:arylsulfatase
MNRCHIRSVFDGRYKFSRYFAPKQHNRPETLEEILKYNDIELFDLQKDPYEERNLCIDSSGNKKLILAMNEKLNALIDSEIGEDVGQMLPQGPGASWAITKFDL